jgi:Spy/CpxP family protein refolding chaperone
MMNRVRAAAIGAALLFALTAVAQQTTSAAGKHKPATVEDQVKIFTERLDLTSDQQASIKPILQQLHDDTSKVLMDKSLSREERMAKARPSFYEADRKIRALLDEDQKKKLDRYEQGPHPEMHNGLDDAPSAPGAAGHR